MTQKSFSNNLTGVGNQDKGGGLGTADEVSQLHRLSPMHGGQDDCFLVMGEGSLGFIYGSAAT